MSPQLATRAPGSTTTGDPGQITAPCEGVPSPQEGLWNSEVGKGVWRMVWKEKGRVRPLHFQRSSAAKEGGQEGKAFSSLSLNAPHPQTHRCQTALVKKTSLQTHSDFWEAAQLYSLSSSPLPGQFPEVGVGGGGVRGELGKRTRRGAHACQEPARPHVFSSCDRGGDSTFRTPAGSSGR